MVDLNRLLDHHAYDVIEMVGEAHAEAASDDDKRTKAQHILEKIFIALMKVIGPIWLATGRMSKEAFFAFLKYFPTMAIEMIPVRINAETDALEILMFPRGDDPFPEYANRLHTPGCMLMPGMNIRKGLNRVVERETGVPYAVITGVPISPDLGISPRGYEVPVPFLVQLHGDLPADSKGQWVPIDDLPRLYEEDKIIRAQYDSFIKDATRILTGLQQVQGN